MANRSALLPGTLDVLILRTVARESMHGYGIAQYIKRQSHEALTVEEGSLYPALQRLLLKGWVKAEWKSTETNRRARFYSITARGQTQMGLELSRFRDFVEAIMLVLQDA